MNCADKIMQSIETVGPGTYLDIAEDIGEKRKTVSGAITRLARSGALETWGKISNGTTGAPLAIWAIKEQA